MVTWLEFRILGLLHNCVGDGDWQVFKTNLLFNTAVSVGGPDGNKFLFSQENKLVENRWPPSMLKILGENTIINLVGEQHRYSRALKLFLICKSLTS